jgi:hypothetical protein
MFARRGVKRGGEEEVVAKWVVYLKPIGKPQIVIHILLHVDEFDHNFTCASATKCILDKAGDKTVLKLAIANGVLLECNVSLDSNNYELLNPTAYRGQTIYRVTIEQVV